MFISTESSASHPAPHAINSFPHSTRLEDRLPPLLSVIAGMVDVIGFISLKLFSAHVTGNLVVIAALLVRGGPPNLAQILAVPMFMLAVAAVWLIAKMSARRGTPLARPLLLVQFLLLLCLLIFSVMFGPAANPRGFVAGVAAMIAVWAMACQFALLRLALPVAPSTAVMTGNLTNTVLSLLDTLSPSEPLMEGATERLKKTLQLVVGFCGGCVAGAVAESWLGDWAWSLPAILAGLAVVDRGRRRPAPYERAPSCSSDDAVRSAPLSEYVACRSMRYRLCESKQRLHTADIVGRRTPGSSWKHSVSCREVGGRRIH